MGSRHTGDVVTHHDFDIGGDLVPVRIVRSQRRRRTVQARFVDGVAEVRLPMWCSWDEELELAREVVEKLLRRSTRPHRGDEDLEERARRLNEEVLEGRARPTSVRWVTNQNRRWGSCTLGTGEIRISHRLKRVPDYVLDSVIVHELVHTFAPAGHGPEFWRWADRAPHAERAKGYLEAYERWGAAWDEDR